MMPSSETMVGATADTARAGAAPPLIALRAHISEATPRDLRGVETLMRVAGKALGAEPRVIEGRHGPFGRAVWAEDLAASREILTAAGTELAAALARAPRPPLTVAPDCALALGTLPAVARLRPAAHVFWLDAHCDYDTPETTTIGFLGCMSLAGACGAWVSGLGPPFPPRRVVLCGTRPGPGAFDSAAQRLVEASDVRLVAISDTTTAEVLAALRDAPVYVHLDPDVLDPSVNPVPYARPGGLSAEALREVLATVAARHEVVGVEVTAFHAPDDPADRDALGAFLVDAVTPLLMSARHAHREETP